jgi:hypothetical protein
MGDAPERWHNVSERDSKAISSLVLVSNACVAVVDVARLVKALIGSGLACGSSPTPEATSLAICA